MSHRAVTFISPSRARASSIRSRDSSANSLNTWTRFARVRSPIVGDGSTDFRERVAVAIGRASWEPIHICRYVRGDTVTAGAGPVQGKIKKSSHLGVSLSDG